MAEDNKKTSLETLDEQATYEEWVKEINKLGLYKLELSPNGAPLAVWVKLVYPYPILEKEKGGGNTNVNDDPPMITSIRIRSPRYRDNFVVPEKRNDLPAYVNAAFPLITEVRDQNNRNIDMILFKGEYKDFYQSDVKAIGEGFFLLIMAGEAFRAQFLRATE
jgi:hypothetical protein